jgi:L-lactate dehydrogenase complex protein LldE
MDVDLFAPCFVDQLYPDTAESTRKLLEKAGMRVHYNPAQTCCGQPSFNSGYVKETRKLAEKFLRDFPGDRPIVGPSASCTGFIRNHYRGLFDSPQLRARCDKLAANIFELTDFLVNKTQITDFSATFEARITYHDACAALREYGIKREPRELLARVKGLELVEMEEPDTCCGFGGTFSVKMEPISTAMAQQKAEHALATGAAYIVSTEASCLMQLQTYIDKQKLPIRTLHIADLLALGMGA